MTKWFWIVMCAGAAVAFGALAVLALAGVALKISAFWAETAGVGIGLTILLLAVLADMAALWRRMGRRWD